MSISQDAFNECYKNPEQDKIYIFTMNDYENFELGFKKFIEYLPEMMEKNDIVPTVNNIKDCLISFVEEVELLPREVKDQFINEIENSKDFANIINDKEELDVVKYNKVLEPIDMKKIEEINKKHENGTLTEVDVLNYKIGLDDIHH
jgi:hypothetical protein